MKGLTSVIFNLCYTINTMKKIIHWVSGNKILSLIIVLISLALINSAMQNFSNTFNYSSSGVNGFSSTSGPMGMSKIQISEKYPTNAVSFDSSMPREGMAYREVPPANAVEDRMVITNMSFSFVVGDVATAMDKMSSITKDLGGFVVSSDLSRPEEGGVGFLSVRIPADKVNEAEKAFGDQVKTVVSKNVSGMDVTDQFVDNEERLRVLRENKTRFESIMNSATNVEEILQVQREIFNLQSEIESIQGRQKYLEETSKTVLISIYLSTDELSLPYSPTNAWRPEVVFKTAVRSLLATLQSLGNLVIWLAVFSVIWLPITLIVFLIYKKKKNVDLKKTVS